MWRFWSETAANALAERETLARILRAAGYPKHRIADAQRIFGELVGNVVKHCPDSSIAVELVLVDGRTFLRITDDGGPFTLRADDLDDMWAETGRGLAIVARLGGQVAVHASGVRKTVIVDLPQADSENAAEHAA